MELDQVPLGPILTDATAPELCQIGPLEGLDPMPWSGCPNQTQSRMKMASLDLTVYNWTEAAQGPDLSNHWV